GPGSKSCMRESSAAIPSPCGSTTSPSRSAGAKRWPLSSPDTAGFENPGFANVMEAPLMHMALVGTPNSGKTSLFNALTGSRQKVANYPGVTVERKEGVFVTPLGRQVSLVDLPGTYSLRGRSPDEEITRDMVLGRTPGEALPDLVLCVADATNLRLTIRLMLELKNTGRPLALVLNMFDIAKRRGVTVDVPRLSQALGVPVVTSIAVRKGGTADLLSLTDQILSGTRPLSGENLWRPLTVPELRA